MADAGIENALPHWVDERQCFLFEKAMVVCNKGPDLKGRSPEEFLYRAREDVHVFVNVYVRQPGATKELKPERRGRIP